MSSDSFTLQDMAADSEWVRGLARAILGDVALADDLAQETIAAALESTPGDPTKRRAWLAGILRNRWRLHVRSRTRSKKREKRVARREAVEASHEDVFEQMEVHIQLLEAVLRLHEPYRTAIALRFYRERSNAEISEELGIPESTVRAQVSRGVALLREELDRRNNGDRAEWALPLAGWVAFPRGTKAAAAGAASATAFSLVALGKWAAVVIALIAGLWFALGTERFRGKSSPAVSNDRPSVDTPEKKRPAKAKVVPVASIEPAQPIPVSGSFANLAEAVAAIPAPEFDPSDWPILGQVTDGGGLPVAELEVTATPSLDRPPSTATLAELVRHEVESERAAEKYRVTVTTDADGLFELRGLHWTRYRVAAVGDGWTASPGDWVGLQLEQAAPAKPTPPVYLELTNAAGRPAHEATLEIEHAGETRTMPWERERSRPLSLQPGTTRVRASIGGVPVSETIELTAPYQGAQPVKLAMTGASTITVEPVGLHPRSERDVTLFVLRVDPRHVPPASELPRAGLHVRGDEGRFALEVPHGTYQLGLGSRERVWISETVEVGSDRHISLSLLDPLARSFRVNVRGLDGVEEFRPRFTQRVVDGNRTRTGGLHSISLNDGSFLIPLEDREWESFRKPGVEFHVGLNTPLGTREVLAEGPTLDMEFESGVPSRMLVDNVPAAEVAEDLVLRWKVDGGSAISGPGVEFDLADEIDLGVVQPGKYTLELTPRALRSSGLVLASLPVEISGGSSVARFALPDLHPVTWKTSRGVLVHFSGPRVRGSLFLSPGETTVVLPVGEHGWASVLNGAPGDRQTLNVPQDQTIEIGE